MPLRISLLVTSMMLSLLFACIPVESRLDPNDRSFTIDIPSDWIHERDDEVALLAFSPPVPKYEESMEGVAVMVEILPKPLSLKRYWTLALNHFNQDYAEIVIHSEEDCMMSGLPAIKVNCSLIDDEMQLEAVIYVTVKGKKGYALMFIAPYQQFQRSRSKFESMKETFRIIE